MRYVTIGRRGIRVSHVGLGAWQIGSRSWGGRDPKTIEECKKAILKGLELGVNLVDTAEVYGGGLSEKVLGELIGNRDDVVVVTKVAGYRCSRNSILKALESSRRRLRRDYIDLALYHWPPPVYVPICNVIRALEEAVDRGLAFNIGVSNFSSKLLKKALECLRKYEITVNQVQYNLAYRIIENDLRKLMENEGITLIAWSPLAKGALAGKVLPDNPARRGDKVFLEAARDHELQKTLENIAIRYQASKAAISLAWLIEKKAIPIPGVRKIKHAEEAAYSLRIMLKDEDVELLDKVSRKYVKKWGLEYSGFKSIRYTPGFLQALALKLSGGI